MSIHHIFGIVLRQLYLFRYSPARILPIIVWVGIDIILWGFITKYLNSVSGAGLNFVSLFLGAVLFWDFSSRVMHGVTTAFLEDVWSRNFLNLFASPLSIAEYLTGLIITSIATSLIGLLCMLLLSTIVFGLSFFTYGILLIPFLLILFLFGIAVGIVGSAIVLRLGPASEWLVWPIPAILSPFVGVFYPIDTLPHWMQLLSLALPPSYVFEAMRGALTLPAESASLSLGPLLVGTALAAIYLLIACGIFVRVYRYTVRTGLLARYSAESVG
jgi:ABC-2 type transport system permease protein